MAQNSCKLTSIEGLRESREVMQTTFTVTEFPNIVTILRILTNTEEKGQIDIAVMPEGGTDEDQFMVSIDIETIAVYNTRARNSFRREDRGKREISVNIAGRSHTSGLVHQSDDTRVEVEFYFEDEHGVLGASALAA